MSVAVKHAAKTTAEGPHWDPIENCLFFVDGIQGDVHKWDPITKKDDVIHLGRYLSGLQFTLFEF